MLAIGARALTAVSWISSKYLVKRIGIKNFFWASSGYIALSEILDEGAEHSEWIAENKDAILNLAVLGSLGAGSVLGKRGIKGLRSFGIKSSTLFSTIKIRNSGRAISSLWRAMKVTTLKNGCIISLPKGRSFSISIKGGVLSFDNKAGLAGATLLAGGFGLGLTTQSRGEEIDWESTGKQLMLVLADLEYSRIESKLRDQIRSIDAITMLNSSVNFVKSFVHSEPNFPRDTVVAMVSSSLSTEDTIIGGAKIDAFIDEEDDFIITVNDVSFIIDDGKLVSARSAGRSNKVLSEAQESFVETLETLLVKLATQRGSDFIRIGNSEKFVSESVAFDEYALAFVFDNANVENGLQLIVATPSLMDSASKNLEDETTQSFLASAAIDIGDEINEWSSSVLSFFSGNKEAKAADSTNGIVKPDASGNLVVPSIKNSAFVSYDMIIGQLVGD